MSIERLQTYIDEMLEIGQEIRTFVAGMTYEDFAGNILAQRGIGMNLLMIGEASMQLAKEFPEFVADHPDIPWIKIRGMRNRIAHGYRSINVETLWDTVQTSIPDLLDQLHSLRNFRAQGE